MSRLFPTSPNSPKSAHARKKPRRVVFVFASITLFLVLFAGASVAAWQVDTRNHRGKVARATTLVGMDVSNESSAELNTSLVTLQERLRKSSIDIGHDSQKFTTTAESIALDLDIDRTAHSVMRFSHSKPPIERFGRWIASFFHNSAATPIVTFDNARLSSIIDEKDPGPRTPPTNPTIEFKNGKFSAVKGRDGSGLMNADAPKAIQKAVKHGFPLLASVPTGVIPPMADTEVDSIIAEAELVTAQPLNLTANGKSAVLSPDQLKPLMRTDPAGGHLQLGLDTGETLKTLENTFPNAGNKPVEAGYDIQNNIPVIVDGRSGTACCSDESPTRVSNALRARLSGSNPATPVDLPMKTVQPKTTKADVPDLGIKEVIGTFTTRHAPNQPRVQNIHLISDLTRGTVIKPGDTFSINDAIGERTTEKGFVVDHVIADGKFAESVGGGISQYATTLFNAAFFGGLDFGEYQAHSIYINRYPFGREATVSFPHPDLQIKNTTPYGVLIWPTYTGTSVTVTLYSTKYATGAQTNQTTEPSGKCTRVRTERTRTYVDGHTSIDSVGALYQPKEGERC